MIPHSLKILMIEQDQTRGVGSVGNPLQPLTGFNSGAWPSNYPVILKGHHKGFCEALLHQASKYCVIGTMLSQTYGDHHSHRFVIALLQWHKGHKLGSVLRYFDKVFVATFY